jgi:hypothetical protein
MEDKIVLACIYTVLFIFSPEYARSLTPSLAVILSSYVPSIYLEDAIT